MSSLIKSQIMSTPSRKRLKPSRTLSICPTDGSALDTVDELGPANCGPAKGKWYAGLFSPSQHDGSDLNPNNKLCISACKDGQNALETNGISLTQVRA